MPKVYGDSLWLETGLQTGWKPACQMACSVESLTPGRLVGATGFEPATCGTQNRRATRLRHAPKAVPGTGLAAGAKSARGNP